MRCCAVRSLSRTALLHPAFYHCNCLDFWLPQLTRLARHPGCFRYAWSFRPDERPLPANPWAYPKAKTALHVPRFIEERLAA
jgi:hypothetical protein